MVQGVTEMFGIMGSAFMDAIDIFAPAGIRLLPVVHEQGDTHMADDYARASGRHGVVIGQNGPGISNCVTAIAAAYWARSPVVIITPQAGFSCAVAVSLGLPSDSTSRMRRRIGILPRRRWRIQASRARPPFQLRVPMPSTSSGTCASAASRFSAFANTAMCMLLRLEFPGTLQAETPGVYRSVRYDVSD